LNRGPTYWDSQPTWSPDGKTIIFNETKGSQALGWLMVFNYADPQTAAATYLRSGSYGSNASYSPDGFTLAYESLNTFSASSTIFHIFFLKNSSGNAPYQMSGVIAKAVDFDPVWRPAGGP
jgi:Tol biopolymer transport system component